MNRCGVWSVECGVWVCRCVGVRCHVRYWLCPINCGVWSVGCGVWECRVWGVGLWCVNVEV